MNLNYTQLDIDHKRELLVNFQSAMFAFAALESISGEPKQEWIKQIVAEANDTVDGMTDEEVEKLICGIEDQHQGVTRPWVAIVAEIPR